MKSKLIVPSWISGLVKEEGASYGDVPHIYFTIDNPRSIPTGEYEAFKSGLDEAGFTYQFTLVYNRLTKQVTEPIRKGIQTKF
jgi:hypothetical protein